VSHTETITPERLLNNAEVAGFRHALDHMSGMASAKGDPVQAAKFLELSDKLGQEWLTIAFCGHFSAGKSTLVNAICGASLLPSSPIPTSANVVTIVNGEPSAEMVFRDSEGREYPPKQVAVENLHDLAVDGAGVSSIKVSYPIPLLGDRMAIVDTPGVDSTDGAHRAATESALHLADVVFYVTDYNHVQSEVNFRFLRSLTRWGKPAYLIVNQIDKHREEQLAFSDFQDSLRQALDNWGIDTAGIVFLSLRDLDHPLSQWQELTKLMASLQPLAAPLMIRSAERSAIHLAEQFRETLHHRHLEQRERLLAKLGADGEAEQRAVLRASLNEQLDAVQSAGDVQKEQFRSELERLLNNANVTPAETREKARLVLEAVQPGFKAGWLASAAKTEAERLRRLELLASDFNRQVSANMNGHLRDLLRKEAKEAGWDAASLEASLEAAFPPVTADWLRQQVKPGADADGQATLQYASEIGAEIKAQYRKTALQWSEEFQAKSKPEREAAVLSLQQQLTELNARDEAAAALAAMEEEEKAEERRMLELLPNSADLTDFELPAPQPAANLITSQLTPELLKSDTTGELSESNQNEIEHAPAEQHEAGASQMAADKLERAAALLSRLPALSSMADSLSGKAERFRHKRFTIALFGAFSAGKSSFANALVGKPVLPVSPNPTTATINRILAPYGDAENGTALITMKSVEAFTEDLVHSLKRLGIEQKHLEKAGADIPQLLRLTDDISADELHPRGRPHLAFLKAAASGWAVHGPKLGKQLTVGEEEYRRYAAEEQASCFVAEIDLYVDSPLTRSGAVLVDTPGADSINARHTGVAFQYIKNADAVLFVTYYNHAFTEADREFLNQLGSVKDVFELDKMFFVINASDLAASETELGSVREHVGTQLLKHGIRNPRLFAVSSLNGLSAKRSNDKEAIQASGLMAFEQAFHAFSENELGGLALASANKELDRVERLLDSWLQSANTDAATRDAKAQRLRNQAEQWRVQGSGILPPAAVQPLLQEIAEQLYHLRQRVRYRFNEHFQAAFHPSVLQDDGRDLKKMLLACWADLKRSLGEDLLQELRAAGLRLEGTVHKMVESAMDTEAVAELAEEGFTPEPLSRIVLELPLIEPYAAGPHVEGRALWSAFRSPKHFFEKEGKNALRDELENQLFNEADAQLSAVKEQWNDAVTAALNDMLKASSNALAQQLAAFAESLSRSLLEPGEERILTDLKEQWRKIRQ
jgi:GTPase Era involved in 16S rRNA processing